MLIPRNGSRERPLNLSHSEILLLVHFTFCKGKVLVRKSYLTVFTLNKMIPVRNGFIYAETYTYQYCSFSWTLLKFFSLKVSGIDIFSDIYPMLGYVFM